MARSLGIAVSSPRRARSIRPRSSCIAAGSESPGPVAAGSGASAADALGAIEITPAVAALLPGHGEGDPLLCYEIGTAPVHADRVELNRFPAPDKIRPGQRPTRGDFCLNTHVPHPSRAGLSRGG